jgi:predicted HTH domain antitoxin
MNTEETVAIPIPQTILYATRMTTDELRRELAVYLFQQEKLSFGKAREMAAMTIWDFQYLLGQRGIAVHYDIPEYEADKRTLQELRMHT